MTELSINEILGLIQHRYPFVLVDRIIEIVPGAVSYTHLDVYKRQSPRKLFLLHYPKMRGRR